MLDNRWQHSRLCVVARSHRTLFRRQKALIRQLVWSIYIFRLKLTQCISLSLLDVLNNGRSWLVTQRWHWPTSLQWDALIGYRTASWGSKVQLAKLLRCWLLTRGTQDGLQQLMQPTQTKCHRGFDAPLMASTTDFTCSLAAFDVDVWGGVKCFFNLGR